MGLFERGISSESGLNVACARGYGLTVAGGVERAEARGVLGELVRPQHVVWLAPRDPMPIHICKEVIAAEGFDEGCNAAAVVRWHEGSF